MIVVLPCGGVHPKLEFGRMSSKPSLAVPPSLSHKIPSFKKVCFSRRQQRVKSASLLAGSLVFLHHRNNLHRQPSLSTFALTTTTLRSLYISGGRIVDTAVRTMVLLGVEVWIEGLSSKFELVVGRVACQVDRSVRTPRQRGRGACDSCRMDNPFLTVHLRVRQSEQG